MIKEHSILNSIRIPKNIEFLRSEINKQKNKIQLTGLVGSSFALQSSLTISDSEFPQIFILESKESALYFLNDLESLLKKEVLFFPASNFKNYEEKKYDSNNSLLRSEVLYKTNHENNSIIVTYTDALFEKVVNRNDLKKLTIELKRNDFFSLDKLQKLLNDLNFNRVDFVAEPGEYSIRGGIVDIYSYSEENPYRLEFFDDEIESIRSFNINSQLSIKHENHFTVTPNPEFNFKTKRQNFLSYFPQNTTIWLKDILLARDHLNNLYSKSNQIHKENKLLSGDEYVKQLSEFTTVENNSSSFFNAKIKIEFSTIPIVKFNKNFKLLKEELKTNDENNYKNYILCSSEKQKKRLGEIINVKEIKYHCLIISLHEGFVDKVNKYAIYTDHQIFNRYHRVKSKTKFVNKQSITIRQLNSLEIGDYVTHIDHGIGRFNGLHKIENNGKTQEVIKLLYKDGDILYISIHSLHKIAKYSSKEGLVPKINQLGSPAWAKTKQKTKSKVKEIAFNLIQLYAKRKLKKGFKFSPDSYLQHELEASFMYEDTPDQEKATKDVKTDMEKESPMDRLICGDVGFGKTEIAIRAAFKAVCDSKQVAILVPTTILALQHYKTFKKRLENLPCNIDYINRFKSKKEQLDTIKNLVDGKIDILIGTHRIVSKDIKFMNLGLLIIDEEQKFGVNIKDKIKLIKENIDTLTLSATPIPRTLQFSLLGARDLSIINTPPLNRQSIETKVISLNNQVIQNAINYEISRGGQIYFIHNRIDNISEIANFLNQLCPKARIKIGHGQMKGGKLENLMVEFIEGQFDLLVSTTIIENGVDVPNANTIIINQAQNFGLSDLHQMRGRVGRSNQKAFCFLISPPKHIISNESRKRLDALEQFSELGSGFKIAMRDLDIRGAGDLLGADQSGFINEIGFETYQKILNEAIDELKEEKFQKIFEKDKEKIYNGDCHLDTDLEILIPDTYVTNISERLNLYKEINNLKSESDILSFSKNIKDRFGELPTEIYLLYDALRIKWLGKKLGFTRVILKDNKVRAYLPDESNNIFYKSSNFTKILTFVKENFKTTKMIKKRNKLSILIEDVQKIENAVSIFKDLYDN